jgi:hypothetical protein
MHHDEVIVNKINIFYQKMSENSLCGIENLINIDELNELSILKNLSTRIDNDERYCLMNDIFIFFLNRNDNYENEVETNYSEYGYYFTEWFDNKLDIHPNNLVLIKSDLYMNEVEKTIESVTISNYTETIPIGDNILTNIFQHSTLYQIIKYKNIKLYQNYINFYKKVFDLFSKFDISSLQLFRFSGDNEIYWSIKVIPIFPTFKKNENLNIAQILKQSGKGLSIHSKKEIQKMIILLDLENSFAPKAVKFFKDLSLSIIEMNYEFLILLFEVLRDINSLHYFRNIFFLFMLSYFSENIKEIYNTHKKNFIFEDFRKYTLVEPMMILTGEKKLNSLKTYSNILLVILFKWLSDIISQKFENGNNIPKENIYNLAMLFYDKKGKGDLEYIKTINEVFYNKVSAEVVYNSSKACFSSFVKNNFNDIIQGLQNDLTSSSTTELRVIMFCERFFDFKLVFDYYKLGYLNTSNNSFNSSRGGSARADNGFKFIEMAKIILTKTYEYYENLELRNLFIKQIWGLEFDNYEQFFLYEENVFNFFQKNRFIDYIKAYRKTFFAEYTIPQFFNRYMPVLEDIDDRYDCNINYTEALTLFFKDLQNLEKFQELFEVNKNTIKINFISYCLLTNLVKNIKEEMAIRLQTNTRRRFIYNFVNYLRRSAFKIQAAWKSYYFSKINDFDYDRCYSYISNRYKKDPVLLKIFRNVYHNMDHLINQQETMSIELDRYKKENSELKSTISNNTSMVKKRNNMGDSISDISNSKYASQLSIKSYNSVTNISNRRSSMDNRTNNLNSSDITTSNVSIKSLMDSVEVYSKLI